MRGAVPSDNPPATDPSPGHIDQDGQRAVVAGGVDAGGNGGLAGRVTAHPDHTAAELPGQPVGPVGVEVEHDDAHPEAMQPTHGGRTESSRTTGDDGGTAVGYHRPTSSRKRSSLWKRILFANETSGAPRLRLIAGTVFF